jgi:hypothetical protein
MKIEISPIEYWKVLSYEDSLLYCSLLVIDGKDNWRMINSEKEYNIVRRRCKNVELCTDDFIWGEYNRSFLEYYEGFGENIWVVPVRDI